MVSARDPAPAPVTRPLTGQGRSPRAPQPCLTNDTSPNPRLTVTARVAATRCPGGSRRSRVHPSLEVRPPLLGPATCSRAVQPRDLSGRTRRRLAVDLVGELEAVDRAAGGVGSPCCRTSGHDTEGRWLWPTAKGATRPRSTSFWWPRCVRACRRIGYPLLAVKLLVRAGGSPAELECEDRIMLKLP